jgi:hypothetical protein
MNTPIKFYERKQYPTTLRYRRGDAYNDLVKLSTWFIDPNQPQGVKGTADAFNTAQVNPLIDRRGVVGRNLFDGFLEVGAYEPNTVGATIFKSVNEVNVRNVFPIQIVGNQTYTFSTGVGDSRIWCTDSNNVVLSSSFAGASITFTSPVEATRLYFRAQTADLNRQIMLKEGSTALPFEPYGKANVLMTNVAWTNLDGYKVETINGKTNVFFNLDGVDTFGALNSASAPNPTGSDDFWQLVVFRPEASSRYCGLVRNTSSSANMQYGLLVSASGLEIVLQSAFATVSSDVSADLKYIIYGRINGRRFAVLNGLEVHDTSFATSITTTSNTQLGCRSNSADGLVKAALQKGLQGICAMQVAPQGTIDKAKVVSTVAKAMKQIYGLGV